MPTGQIQSVKLGDPGVGFTLVLSEPIQSGKIEITLTARESAQYVHVSSLTINAPITEPQITILMPYGCDHYVPGSRIPIEITVTKDNNPFVTYSDEIIAQDGIFDFNVKRLTLPSVADDDFWNVVNSNTDMGGYVMRAGRALYSPNGRYVCRLEYNGTLAVYDLQDPNDPGVPKSKSLKPSGNPGNGKYYMFLNRYGNLRIYDGDYTAARSNTKFGVIAAFDDRSVRYTVNLTDEGALKISKDNTDLNNSDNFKILNGTNEINTTWKDS